MISVKAEYANFPTKTGRDYFIYTDIEVCGHAEHTGHTTNLKVCAGVSACCYGIRRLIDDNQYNIEYRSGYYHIWTNRRNDIRHTLDKDSVHALNTLVCQLYEIYCDYPRAFNSFNLVDVKEKIENDERKQNTTRFRKSRKKRMGLYSLIQSTHSQEN